MTNIRPTVDGSGADITSEPIERVVVGIPDVFTAEQFARLQGLCLAEKVFSFRFNKEAEDGIGEAIKAADRLANYLLSGEGVQS